MAYPYDNVCKLLEPLELELAQDPVVEEIKNELGKKAVILGVQDTSEDYNQVVIDIEPGGSTPPVYCNKEGMVFEIDVLAGSGLIVSRQIGCEAIQATHALPDVSRVMPFEMVHSYHAGLSGGGLCLLDTATPPFNDGDETRYDGPWPVDDLILRQK